MQRACLRCEPRLVQSTAARRASQCFLPISPPMAPHPAAHCQALVLVVLVVVLVLNLLCLPVRCLCGKPPPPHAEDANAAGGFLGGAGPGGLRGQTGEQSCDNTVARQFAAMVRTGACLPAARCTWPAWRTRVAVPAVANVGAGASCIAQQAAG